MDQSTPVRRKRKPDNSESEIVNADKSSVQCGQQIYIRSKHGWETAVLKDVTSDNRSHGNKAFVAETTSGEELVCRQEDVLHCSNVPLCSTERLSDLAPLNEATVLHCLWERFELDCIYTKAGSTVVAVNPFKDISDLYSLDTVEAYCTRQPGNKESKAPHIYEIAEEAHGRLQRDSHPQGQCIIVSGESGAGKTVSAKHLLRYLTVVANPHTDLSQDRKLSECTGKGKAIERRILDSNPILEAFGNAVTPRNNNSSRFGKFIQLQFQRSGHVKGAKIETYLLEKTRVVHQGAGDCNFHIFYQLCGASSSVPDTEQPGWVCQLRTLLQGHSFNIVPGKEGVTERKSLRTTLEAMSDIGLSDHLQQAVLQVIAAILFLCNVDFTAEDEDYSRLSSQSAQMSFLERSCLELSATCEARVQCCHLLGISADTLEQVLLHRSIESGGNKRRSVFVKPLSIADARTRRDCLAMLLYSRLFDWLVNFLNQQIKSEEQSRMIGLLDIYGFEMFDVNSLEQLCINYANEKLQQHYVCHFLGDLQREYEAEHIPWRHIDYHDNQLCLDVLEGRVGVFGVLNEEVYLNRKSNPRSLGERVLDVNNSAPIKRPKTFSTHPGFVIQHYAGDVRYDLEQITTKNKDNIPVELVRLLQQSDNAFLSHLFEEFHTVEMSGRKRKTVLTKFKVSLDGLLATLKSCDVHYVRCIKPNQHSQPGQLDPTFVLQQLKANGILETVEICRKGYSARLPYWDFLQRYGLLIRDEEWRADGSGDKGGDVSDPVEILLQKQRSATPHHSTTPQRVLRRRTGLSSLDHTRKCCAVVLSRVLGPQFVQNGGVRDQFGKNKIFLLQQQFEALEAARNGLLARYAMTLQRAWRRYLEWRQRRRMLAVGVIWAAWKTYTERRCRARQHMAACCIQRGVQCWLAKCRLRDALKAIHTRTIVPGSSWVQQSPSQGGKRKLQLNPSDRHPVSSGTPCPQGLAVSKENLNPRTDLPSVWESLSEDSGIDDGAQAGGSGYDMTGPPTKRLKLTCSTYGNLHDVHIGDGVVTRRKIPVGGMRFHTRASVLKNAHVVHKRELERGITDCLMDNLD
ncbi:unconventional myosin-XIX-like isoform X1 [Haliotis rufescens]|uniref:unconventional myosin-XIX-like isoform X1 n=1 Tax=Haliotis rufescens TaxID=6454 RepID=UPI00201F3F52|nr:unconventional myosin-XIX-like isoform X1 [Haliotis rufescens]